LANRHPITRLCPALPEVSTPHDAGKRDDREDVRDHFHELGFDASRSLCSDLSVRFAA